VYVAHSMTCVWIRLNVCREGLPPYEHRCALLRLETLVKRRSITCIMFIFDVLGGRMNSLNLLSALDLNTPRYQTRGSELNVI
jgi:hypothetical protein